MIGQLPRLGRLIMPYAWEEVPAVTTVGKWLFAERIVYFNLVYGSANLSGRRRYMSSDFLLLIFHRFHLSVYLSWIYLPL